MDRLQLAELLGHTLLTPGTTAAMAAAARGPVVICERDPQAFQKAFLKGVIGGGRVFLADPAWGERERAQAEAIWNGPTPTKGANDWLMIPTGGSSGDIKFARHDTDTLAAAARGCAAHFELKRINTVGVLPLHHVSGLMGWLRTVFTGGSYLAWDWPALQAGERPSLPRADDGWAISLVPTQLERLMRDASAVAWLREFRVIFVGGAAAPLRLLERAAAEKIPLAPTYGMTETAAMIAATRPKEFLAGSRDVGYALPHARLSLGENGCIRVFTASMFHGYYPDSRPSGDALVTNDLGRVDGVGRLHVLGRSDELIISGGEKVKPAEVEEVLRRAGGGRVVVLGLPDNEWGQRVVAVHPAGDGFNRAEAMRAAERELAPPKRPKHYLALSDWPENAAGKVIRPNLLALAEAALRAGSQAAML